MSRSLAKLTTRATPELLDDDPEVWICQRARCENIADFQLWVGAYGTIIWGYCALHFKRGAAELLEFWRQGAERGAWRKPDPPSPDDFPAFDVMDLDDSDDG